MHVPELNISERAQEIRAPHETEVVDGELGAEPVRREESDHRPRALLQLPVVFKKESSVRLY